MSVMSELDLAKQSKPVECCRFQRNGKWHTGRILGDTADHNGFVVQARNHFGTHSLVIVRWSVDRYIDTQYLPS